ncbi:MAG: helix-turn-helix domain-containing protein [Candidatus Aenigmarchaeota archaeon]|nr:helix-turn-helix domain-containing protein [Candidatus Aenigmarchaeota archaeon]
MEIENTLKEIGLTEQEIKIYLVMLRSGSILASRIAEETRINRSHVYQILKRLIVKGFTSYVIKENRKYFSAINPEKILELVKEREEKIKLILPQLSKLSHISESKSIVEILEGKEGIKTILNDILRLKEEWFSFGSSGKGPEILPYYIEHWEKGRQKNKIRLKAILDTSKTGKKRGKELSKLNYTEIGYMPSEYSSPSSTWIYKDRVVFVMWSKEHPFAIRTISKEIAESYKNHFKVLWEIAKK